MTPTEAREKKNEETIYFNLYQNEERVSSRPIFKIRDKVGISAEYKRKTFGKG